MAWDPENRSEDPRFYTLNQNYEQLNFKKIFYMHYLAAATFWHETLKSAFYFVQYCCAACVKPNPSSHSFGSWSATLAELSRYLQDLAYLVFPSGYFSLAETQKALC